MKKIISILIIIYLSIILVSCKKNDVQSEISINKVVSNDNREIIIENNSTIDFQNNLLIHYDLLWNYIINNAGSIDKIPTIEIQYPIYYYYDISCDDQIIKSNQNEEYEYKSLNYKIKKNLLYSSIIFEVISSDNFMVTAEGQYKIEVLLIAQINGKEEKFYDCFSFYAKKINEKE